MATTATHGTDLATLGESYDGSLLRYDAEGGTCTEPGCTAKAPVVTMVPFGTVVRLPCGVHAQEQEERREREERRDRAARLLVESGMTPRLAEFSLDTYREKFTDEAHVAALAVAERWLRTLRETGAAPNMLLYGEPGNGKTGLAWGIVRALCEDGHRAKLVNFKRLLDEMRSCYQQRLPASHAFEVGRVPILALDDLGSERPTEWARDQLLAIVDDRYEAGLPTIFVSNYTPDTLAKRLGRDDATVGERILSRMVEGAVQHRLRAGDQRLLVEAAI